MLYFAGLFDAEGSVSMMATGHFIISIEMANEEIPNSFKEAFGGKIYSRKRKSKKKTFTWDIATNREEALNFIEKISPFSVIKKSQLILLKEYLNSTRTERKEFRETIRNDLRNLKQPLKVERDYIDRQTIIAPDTTFFQWMAGMIDGDGNFCIYEVPQSKWISFQSWIGVFNINPDPIAYIKERIPGHISQYRQSINPVWKWACMQDSQKSTCQNLIPFLRIKKQVCKIVLDYHEIKENKVPYRSYSNSERDTIRDLIRQIKYIHSL